MRIVSLLPSITEIVCALGLESSLVGRSHECDYPDTVESLPACTAPRYRSDGTSSQINRRVKAVVQEGLSVYRVDADLLAALEPDIILTQDHCEVCAASYSEVKKAVETHLDGEIRIVSVSPNSLDEIFLSIERIAEALGAGEAGEELIRSISDRFNKLQSRTARLPTPRAACIEWIDPLMTAGNWFPELVGIAGGESVLARAGERSGRVGWRELADCDPDILLVAPCGYALGRTRSEMDRLAGMDGWDRLRAVKNGRVFLLDGNHYFHRPGPRLAESARILAEIFHPGLVEPEHQSVGWIRQG
ncbi:MAG: cobalamin-binding protein [Balneolaceae bacterium]|nr:cobalamin-binding protein [Balneolaceae bacterium]